jgi:hypothetical protein
VDNDKNYNNSGFIKGVSRISSPSNKTFLRANVDGINVITRKKDNK